MNRGKGGLIIAITLLLGCAGFILRRYELQTAYELSGFVKKGAPAVLLLALFCIISVLIFFVCIIKMPLKKKGTDDAFSPGVLGVTIACAAAVAIAFAGYSYITDYRISGKAAMVLSILAFLAALGTVLCFIEINMKKSGNELMLFSCLPIAFYVLYLIIAYKQCSADPELQNYVYRFLALSCIIMSFYYFAGYSFGIARPQKLVFFSCCAFVLSMITAADVLALYDRLFTVGGGAASLAMLASFNLRTEKRKGEEEL